MSAFEPFFDPSDLSACVEAGESVRAFNRRIEPQGAYFPLWRDEAQTFGQLFAETRYCSRSFRFGAVKDNLLGARFRLHGGQALDLGGRVVKNVVGFDLTRFVAGSGQALGRFERLVLRLRPLPQIREEWSFEGPLPKLEALRRQLVLSPWAHALDALDFEWNDSGPRVAVAFGSGPDEAPIFRQALHRWSESYALSLRQAPLPLHEGPESPSMPLSQILAKAETLRQAQPKTRLSALLGQGRLLWPGQAAPAPEPDALALDIARTWGGLE